MDEIKLPNPETIDHAINAILQEMEVDIHATQLEDVASTAGVFRSVESTVSGLRVALLSMTRAIEDRIAYQHRRRNSFVLIHSLPHELLNDILLATFPSTEPKTIKRLQELSQVCSAWWNMIKNHPRFWDSIQDPHLLPDACLLALRKSAALPLTIGWENRYAFPLTPKFRACIDSIASQRHRWRSVDVRCGALGGLGSCFQNQLPVLEELTLEGRWTPWEPLHVAGGPRLRLLDVKYVDSILPLQGSGFAALESLHLGRISATFEDLFKTLEECPRLEHVRIGEFSASSSTAAVTDGIAVLPRLKTLALYDTRAADILRILRHICADGLMVLEVSVWSIDMEGDHSIQLLHHLIQPASLWSTAQRNQPAKTIRIKFDDNGFSAPNEVVLEGAGHIKVHSYSQPCWQVFVGWAKESSVTMFEGIPVRLDLVEFRRSPLSPPTELNLMMQHLGTIKSLIFHYENAEHVFELLAELRPTATGFSWLCPELETITLTARYLDQRDLDPLIPHITTMLHARTPSATLGTAQIDGEGQVASKGDSGLRPIDVRSDAGWIFDGSQRKFIRLL